MALTFMYTKCPMPTYCPMMDRQFAAIQKEIQAKPDLRDKAKLLSVSFDPKNDTPAVLKKHAKQLGADPKLWTFVTGGRDDIDKFAMTFGVTLIRGEASDPNEIGHTLRTAIIDRNGKLVKTYTGNEWSASDIVADLEKLQ
jgi:protein SCO1